MVKNRIERRKPHARGIGLHELKDVGKGPRSVRSRIRVLLLDDLFPSEDEIIKAMRKQQGGRVLFRDHADPDVGTEEPGSNWIANIRVQAAQIRQKLLQRAKIKCGSLRSPANREAVNKQWKALPIAKRRKIVESFGEHASVWRGSYEEDAA